MLAEFIFQDQHVAQQGQAKQKPLPVSNQPRSKVQVVHAFPNQEVEASSNQIKDVLNRSRIQTNQPEQRHEEEEQPPADPDPEPPSIRPPRVIRMSSRFKPYMFWK